MQVIQTVRYIACIDGRGRYHVLDGSVGRWVRNANGRNRWFYTVEAAIKFAEALNRGNKRPSGSRP